MPELLKKKNIADFDIWITALGKGLLLFHVAIKCRTWTNKWKLLEKWFLAQYKGKRELNKLGTDSQDVADFLLSAVVI